MEKIEYYFNSNKHFCWECMEWFESELKYSELNECPLCHVKIENEDDISINLNGTTKEKRIEMFNIIYNSEKFIGYNHGFDQLNGELLIEWMKDLTTKKRKELIDYFGYVHGNKIRDFINTYWKYDKDSLWRETFRRLSKKKQCNIILEYFRIYNETLKIMENKYDWSHFQCNLLKNGEISKLYMIINNWNELGMQVYDCRLSNQQLCPCLKESTTGGTYKCFRRYLESNGLRPETDVPVNMRKD